MKDAKRFSAMLFTLFILIGMLTTVALEVKAASFENTHKNTGNQAYDIVAVAQTQIGYQEGANNYNKYSAEFGVNNVEWCAYFVSWCAKEADISDAIIHRQGIASPFSGYFNIPNTHSSSNYFPKPGDLVFYGPNSSGDHYHVGIVETVNASTGYITTIEGNTNSSGSSTGYVVYRHTRHYQHATICCYGTPNYTDKSEKHTVDSRYSAYSPIAAYTISTGLVSVYDESGTMYSNRYIDGATDICIILEIYTDGWCKVRYPSSAENSGYFDAYVPFSVFTTSSETISWVAENDYITYRRSDIENSMFSISTGTSGLLLKTDGYLKQVIHPISGQSYCMMGWIAEPKEIHSSVNTLTLTLGGTDSQTIYAWSTGYHDGNTALYYSRSNSNINCSWGEWSNGKAPLTVKAASAGTTTLTLGVKDKDTGIVLDSVTVPIIVKAKSYTIFYSANGGSGEPGSQTKTYGVSLTLSSTAPTKTGYTFLGWATSSDASSAAYQPGDSFTGNANTTLYAVWEKGCEEGKHKYIYDVTGRPTLTTTGKIVGKCSCCGETTSVLLPELNTNDYNYKVTREATCTAAGMGRYTWKTTTYGSFCFDVSIPATGHTYTAETKKTEALKSAGNCRDYAVYYYSCTACGNVEYDDSHTFLGDKVAATHVGGTMLINQFAPNQKTQTDGYTGDTKCLGCGEIICSGQIIPVVSKNDQEISFVDINNTDWQYSHTYYVCQRGLMTGKGTDDNGNVKFDPNSPITREEFVQVLYNAESKPSVAIANQFPDVANNGWYKNAVLWANQAGIASGMGNGSFGVGKNITRQDLAMMLYKYAKMKGCSLAAEAGKIDQFADGNKVSSYATAAMDWAVTNGILSGKGESGKPLSTFKLDPTGTATRAECAAMLKNFMTAFGL